MTIDTIILAGGKNSPAMQAVAQTPVRALTPLGPGTMLDCVVVALADAPSVGRLFVVGDIPASDAYTQIPQGATLMDNLFAGIAAACQDLPAARLLVSTSDIPFLTPAGVEDFVAQSLAADADFCYPIIPIEACRAAYPQMKRTTVRLREGTFTGGNLMLVNPQFMLAQREPLARAYAARKRPFQLGAMLGWGLLARLLLAQTLAPNALSIPLLEQGVARLLGGGSRARAIVTHYAEIGTDIDSPEDVAVARQLLGGANDAEITR